MVIEIAPNPSNISLVHLLSKNLECLMNDLLEQGKDDSFPF